MKSTWKSNTQIVWCKKDNQDEFIIDGDGDVDVDVNVNVKHYLCI